MSKAICSFPECGRPMKASGLCATHGKQRSRGKDLTPIRPRTFTEHCTIEGCARPHIARGWCHTHYKRWKEHGDPLHVEQDHYSSPQASFEARTERRGDCLVWTGATYQHGYGTIWHGSGYTSAHRWAYEQKHGPIPDGMYVDHMCWNAACCNVDHLRLVTPSENAMNRDGARAGTATGARNIHRAGDRYTVRLKVDGKGLTFGPFDTIDEAREVAERERLRHFGEYAGRG